MSQIAKRRWALGLIMFLSCTLAGMLLCAGREGEMNMLNLLGLIVISFAWMVFYRNRHLFAHQRPALDEDRWERVTLPDDEELNAPTHRPSYQDKTEVNGVTHTLH